MYVLCFLAGVVVAEIVDRIAAKRLARAVASWERNASCSCAGVAEGGKGSFDKTERQA
jgi:hypothetical protein